MAIEKGRYMNIPVNERVCKVCNMNAIEDEMHVLVYCSVYDDLRNSLKMNITENNVWDLLESNDTVYMNEICTFIYNITEKRTTLLDNMD